MHASIDALLKKWNVHYFTTYSSFKAALIHQYNWTLETRLWTYFSFKNTLAKGE